MNAFWKGVASIFGAPFKTKRVPRDSWEDGFMKDAEQIRKDWESVIGDFDEFFKIERDPIGQAWQFRYTVEQDPIHYTDEYFTPNIPETTRQKYRGKINHPKHRVNARKECLEVLNRLEGYMGTTSCAAEGPNEVVEDKVVVTITGVMFVKDNSPSTEQLVKMLRKVVPADVLFELVHYSWSQKETVILEQI